MHGWLILDKPTGITSAHAVAKVKKMVLSASRLVLGEEKTNHKAQTTRHSLKIGHAGTLDPLASGVLPLALGEATKTVGYMMDASKAYEFTVAWGSETETDDLEGKTTQTSDKRPTMEQILAILPQFTGEIEQTPPSYSAIKVDGKRAYELARGGETVELKARRVNIVILSVSEGSQRVKGDPSALPQDDTSFTCHCGKGTYIRSLARDMGRALGCYGHITRLRRIKVGKFDQNHAISLEKLEEMVHKGDLGFLQPITSALDDIPAVSVNQSQARCLRQGQAITLSPMDGLVQLLDEQGLVAIGEAKAGLVKPVRVFNQ